MNFMRRNTTVSIDQELNNEFKSLSVIFNIPKKNLIEDCLKWCLDDIYIIKTIKKKRLDIIKEKRKLTFEAMKNL